jgi:hypothetical protein
VVPVASISIGPEVRTFEIFIDADPALIGELWVALEAVDRRGLGIKEMAPFTFSLSVTLEHKTSFTGVRRYLYDFIEQWLREHGKSPVPSSVQDRLTLKWKEPQL